MYCVRPLKAALNEGREGRSILDVDKRDHFRFHVGHTVSEISLSHRRGFIMNKRKNSVDRIYRVNPKNTDPPASDVFPWCGMIYFAFQEKNKNAFQ